MLVCETLLHDTDVYYIATVLFIFKCGSNLILYLSHSFEIKLSILDEQVPVCKINFFKYSYKY